MLIIFDRRRLAELSDYGGEPLVTQRMLL
jgi:hypothetical protein